MHIVPIRNKSIFGYGGNIDIHSLLPKTPLVFPGMKYAGPNNPLHEQIQTDDLKFNEKTGEVDRCSIKINPGNYPTSDLDNIALRHDTEYNFAEKTDDPLKYKHLADQRMLKQIKKLNTPFNSLWNVYQKVLENITAGIIKLKYKLGFGVKMTDIINEMKTSRKRTPRSLKKKYLIRNI